jgi:outer membrane protein assembly factor BamE (lipoprotein component of BamABCDE complex)
MALALIACATTVPRGHLKEDEELTDIHVGSSTSGDVQKHLGSPSSKSTFGPSTWYYVSSIHQTRSILPTKVVDQHVIEIAFDASGVVKSVKQYGLADSKNIEVATDTTPTEGQKLGFFEQLLSNLGRFNKNDTGTSNSHTHGDPTGGAAGGYPR